MSRPALYLSRLLPHPVMKAIGERFRLTSTPEQQPPSRDILVEGVRDADAMICTLSEQIDEGILAAAPRLKVIANYAVGFNNIGIEHARARGIVVTNTPDVLTGTTADLTWSLLLAAARRLVEGHLLVQGGTWTGWEPDQLLGTDVHGRTLGIIGMGRIGQAVARRASGFDMQVLYNARTAPPSAPDPRWRAVSFDDLLAESDFVSLHLPLTPETTHVINQRALRRMKPTAILINTSRGPLIDEAALVEALRDGRLAGAGLDVYEQEPALHPTLRELPQVVLLPHLGSATLATRTRMGMVCIENVVAVLAGRPAPNAVG